MSSLCAVSAAMLRSSTAFSSGVSHLAWLIRSSRKASTHSPTSTDGMPSSRNIHCQPAQPLWPSNVCMIQPDSGPPITPDSATAVMNHVVVRPRRSAGYQ